MKAIAKFMLLFSASWLLTIEAFAGIKEGGGGNAILCQDTKLYAWDYIDAKFANTAIDPEFQNAKSADEILNLIAQRLTLLNLPMAASLADFQKRNTDPLIDSNRLWIYTSNPLIAIGDEDRTQIPVSCVASAKPDFALYQAVIRQELADDGKITYQADQKLLDRLAANSPLQLAFLYIHEWLRDYDADPSHIVLVTQLLHGSKIYSMSPVEFNHTLGKFGLNVPTDDLTPFIKPGKYKLIKGPALLNGLEIVIKNYKMRVNGAFAASINLLEYEGGKPIAKVTHVEAASSDDKDNGISLNGAKNFPELNSTTVSAMESWSGHSPRKNEEWFIVDPEAKSGCFNLRLRSYQTFPDGLSAYYETALSSYCAAP